MIYQYHCDICKRDFTERKSVSLRNDVFCCGQQAKRNQVYMFYTEADQMYNFRSEHFGNMPIDIHSRKQYKHLLKRHGMVDASVKECLQVKPDKNKGKYQQRQLVRKVANRLCKDGIAKHFKSFVQNFAVKKEKKDGFKRIHIKRS